jgi:hypothetical protein
VLSHFFFKDSPNLAFVCWMPSCFCFTVFNWLVQVVCRISVAAFIIIKNSEELGEVPVP